MKLEPTEKLANASQNMVNISNYLKDEMQFLIKPILNLDSVEDEVEIMYSLRSVARAQVSHIEATCYLLRRMVLSLRIEELQHCFSDEDVLRLQDLRLDRNDESILMTNFPDTKSNVKFSFSSFAKNFTDGFELEINDGWQSFIKTLQIRNDITHPKGWKGLILDHHEIQCVKETDFWFTEQTNRLLNMAKEENSYLRNP